MHGRYLRAGRSARAWRMPAIRAMKNAVIAASLLRPTQLRIADVISRPPDEWMTGDAMMEFAF